MKHYDYWEAKDGAKFKNRAQCEEYEAKLIEEENKIIYYDKDNNVVVDYDKALIAVLSKKLNKNDYEFLENWEGFDIPNAPGTYVRDDIWEDWQFV